MGLNFKKISALGMSLVMTGLTAGTAMAASFPAPFVDSSGVADVAVVYGASASLDATQAGSIKTALDKFVSSSANTTIDGENYQFEKASTKFHLGDAITDVDSSTIDDRELPILLADGVYTDEDNNEFDYKQEISMAALTLTMFDDDNYKVDSPTVGFEINDGAEVLNYTLDFSEKPNWEDLDTTELPVMGKEYYVLSHSTANNSITLLDSASSTILNEGETVTIDGKSVSIAFIGSNDVKLSVDGDITNGLSESSTYKLNDGSYLGIKDISVQDYQGGVKQVEFSIGNGKLILTDGDEVEMNEDDIDNLIAHFSAAADTLDTITLQWKMDTDSFVTETSTITMPGFETISLSFTGLNYPAEESIIVQADGDDNLILTDFPLEETTETINLLYSDGSNFTIIGKDSNNKLATSHQSENLTFTEGTHDYFIISYMSGDDAESYLVKADGFDDSDYPDNTVDFKYLIDGTWTALEINTEVDDIISVGGLAEFTVESISNESSKTVSLSVAGDNQFNMLYSAEGMEVYLPWMNTTAVTVEDNTTVCTDITDTLATGQLGWNKVLTLQNTTELTCTSTPATYSLVFEEEDKLDAISSGDSITIAVGLDSDNEVYVTGVTTSDNNDEAEIGESDVYREFLYSDLSTEILNDQSGDGEKVTLIYHGAEVAAGVYLTSADAISTSTGSTNALFVKDSEIDSVKSKNLVVVGGSCINSVAATLVGGAYCGSDFTDATDVGTGQFLIKSYADKFTTGKIALLVAGYEAEDTANAALYLTKKTVDTSSAYKGTSSTNAELIVA